MDFLTKESVNRDNGLVVRPEMDRARNSLAAALGTGQMSVASRRLWAMRAVSRLAASAGHPETGCGTGPS